MRVKAEENCSKAVSVSFWTVNKQAPNTIGLEQQQFTLSIVFWLHLFYHLSSFWKPG